MPFEKVFVHYPDGRRFGPATQEEVGEWIEQGRLNINCALIDEETQEMRMVADFPELSKRFPKSLSDRLIPKNGYALGSYYCGVFSLLGIFFCLVPGLIGGLTALALGVMAIQREKENPLLRGRGHAITGIVLGVISALISGGFMVMYAIAMM
jgi:hypothetical protein